jgi:hypothetical protein
MLEHRREFVINFLFDMLRRNYNILLSSAAATASALLLLLLLFFKVLLVIFLQKHELIEPCEGRTQSKVVPYPRWHHPILEFFLIHSIEEVLFKLIYRY